MTNHKINSTDHSTAGDPQPERATTLQPIILHYRTLKTNLLFTLIWLIMAFLSFVLIKTYQFQTNSIEFFTLILSAVICLILAIHSIDTYGGPFLYFNNDHLLVHHSMIRKVVIDYKNIKSINVVKEEVEIILKSGIPVILNLAQLSFEDQAVCLKKLNEVLAGSFEGA